LITGVDHYQVAAKAETKATAPQEPTLERGELADEMPVPVWPEVETWAASVKLLRPVCELSIDRTVADVPPPLPGAEAVDPALWYCHTLNRLQLKVGPGLVQLRADGLAKLSALTTLIVTGNGLTRFVSWWKGACRTARAKLPASLTICNKLTRASSRERIATAACPTASPTSR